MTTQPDSQFEEFWLQRLTLATAEPPYARTTAETLGATKLAPVELPAGLQGESATPALVAGFAAWLHRLTGAARFSVGYGDASIRSRVNEGGNALSGRVPVLFDIDRGHSLEALAKQTGAEMGKASELAAEARDLMLRLPEFVEPRYLCAVEIADSLEARPASNAQLELVIVRTGNGATGKAALAYDPASFDDATATRAARQLSSWLKHLGAEASQPIGKIALVDAAERKRLTAEFNQTAINYPRDKCVHQLFEAQAARTPDDVALVYAGRSLSYAELNARANRLAHVLIAAGAGPNKMIGLCVERSEELVIGALAIQKAGGGYLPLDPAYPQDRIAFMVEDSGAGLIVCQQATADRLAGGKAKLVSIDDQAAEIAKQSDQNPKVAVRPEHLAYCIYTSGSTGKPKGVLIEHSQVVNFFTGMDAHIDGQQGKTWLAVTSLSFDISVLELFWTLGRGFKIVLAGEDRSYLESKRSSASRRPVDFSLFYFASDEDPHPGPEKYRLLTEGAKFADDHGFAAVWTPERHFGAFGGIYPNPAVTGAAIAMITKRVQIRAGSCVVPLHHPARITEEWSLVDNLSNGRVAISFATGWHPKDFLLKPENYKDRREATLAGIETIRKLWRGEEVSFDSPIGPTAVITRPRPVQKDLPIWFTAAGNPATFEIAGKIGANILTHLLGQSVQDLVSKIAAYRKAWKAAGHPGEGKVTLMLHTFVGDDDAEVKRTVRVPMKAYLRSSAELIGEHAWSFPAFKKVANQKESLELNFKKLSPQDMDDLLEYSFERYYEGSSLFGTPETCMKQIDRLKGLGVDEIACLIDFGVPTDDVLGMLPALNRLRQSVAEQSAAAADQADDDFSLSALIQRHDVSHLQCTPSMVRMLLANDDTRLALGTVRHLMVGGEAMTDALAKDIAGATGAKLSNMYGPTETTIWSSVDTVVAGQPITIGRPIANTQLYVLDADRELAPQGAPGELWIAGDGVARGYHNRDDLTASRFAPDPFAGKAGARMYRTGDLVRHMDDGRIEFIGRVDHQVKLRGYRIELGEIEALLNQVPGIKESVVTVREDRAGDPRLVAYLIGEASAIDAGKLKDALGAKLPDYMVPSAFVRMDRFPLTPNKKVDRKALPAPSEAQKAARTEYVSPESEVEEQIATVYQAVLGLPQVGREDHFFDLGGHSLLAVQAHRKLREALGRDLSITDIFRFPTVRALASHLQSDGAAADARLDASSQRASARREAMMRRRGARPT
jgi:natural product biosynthesis luciferase-like monooxygenase protein